MDNSIFRKCTKHIEIHCHFVFEKIREGVIVPEHLNDHFADVLTNALRNFHHHKLLFVYKIKSLFQSNKEGEVEKIEENAKV